MHAKGNTLDELVADAVAKKRQGFTAIRFSPFAPDYHLRKSFEEWVSEAERRVGAVHEALRGDADICIELHRQMNPAESIALGQRLRKFHPYFYEDPMLPDSPAMMGDVQARSGLPVATGERFSSIFQFQELLANNGCAYVRPDVCLCMRAGMAMSYLGRRHEDGLSYIERGLALNRNLAVGWRESGLVHFFMMAGNLALVSGSNSLIVQAFPWLLLAIGLAGAGLALWLKVSRPKVYAHLGRGFSAGLE